MTAANEITSKLEVAQSDESKRCFLAWFMFGKEDSLAPDLVVMVKNPGW